VRDFRTSAHYGTVPKRVADACGASDGARRSDSTPGFVARFPVKSHAPISLC
jgi:hypothetical protein